MARWRRCCELAVEVLAQLLDLGVEVEPSDEVLDGLGAHAALVVVAVAVDDLTPQLLGFDQLLGLHRAEGVEGLLEQLLFDPGPLFAILDLALDLAATSGDFLGLGPGLFHLGQLLLEPLEALVLPLLELVLDERELVAGGVLELDEIGLALVVIDPRDQVRREVDDLLEVLRRHVEQIAEPAGHALEEPDVGDGRGQLDVAHPLAAHLGPGHLDAAALADDAAEADALVLAAVALPVPGGTKDALVEETVLLRLQGPVVDGLRFLYLTKRPGSNLVGAGEADLQFIEQLWHVSRSRLCCSPGLGPSPAPESSERVLLFPSSIN